MENFTNKLKAHAEHVANIGAFCNTEETTKQALIMPFLDILGFTPCDPRRVKAEYSADFPGVKVNERVDYALFCHDVPVIFIEAKSFSEKIDNHCPQLSRYFNSTPEVTISAITNGIEWRFFTDLKQKNIMDSTPFLKLRMDSLSHSDIAQLFRFRYDKFKPEALRTLAEESVYLNAFTKTISSSLREADLEFVRYVAGRSNIERQLNQRFLESVTPLVKQAVERAVSAMVVSGLSTQPAEPVGDVEKSSANQNIVNEDNPNIITTAKELELLERVKQIIQTEDNIEYKDTESYFGILLDGKSNRWLLRFHDKKSSFIMLPISLNEIQLNEIKRARLETDGRRIYITNPEDILRISGLILDAFEYVKNDDNFRRGSKLNTSENIE
ncbi:type I restriction endonuclease [Salmonella enterica]|uniref:type I restriction endonuclease n=1 Tax=Salmonella enterica TaxID=28901 RepID=UPI0009B1526D|nr:type I restriction endonuclease [Salmonella enterica]